MDTLIIVVAVAALLLIFGGLIGHSITERLLRREISRLAAGRKQFSAQRRRAVQRGQANQGRHRCAVCGRLTLRPDDDGDPYD